MSFNAFVNEFTEAPLQTSYSSYLGLDYTGVQGFQLEWTFQNQNTPYPFSTVITTINNASGNTLTLPNAEVTSVGTSTIIINQGAFTLNVLNFEGTSVAPLILEGQEWQLILIDNSTEGGSWTAIQLGSGSTSVSAPSLIDNTTDGNPSGAHGNQGGLLALPLPSQQFLGMNITVNKIANGASAYTQYSGDRGSVLVWLSGSGTYTCQPASEYTNGYNFIIINQGTGILTIAPDTTVPDNTINGSSTIFTLNPSQSSLFVSDGNLTIYSYGTSSITSNPTTILPVDLGSTGSPTSINLTDTQAEHTILEFYGTGPGVDVTINYPQRIGSYIAYNSSSTATIILQIIGNPPENTQYAYGLPPQSITTLISDGSNTNLYMSPDTIYNATVKLQNGLTATPSLCFASDNSSGFYLSSSAGYIGLPTVVYSASPAMSFANGSGTTTCFSALNTVNPVSEDPAPLTSSYFDNSISIYTIMRAYE